MTFSPEGNNLRDGHVDVGMFLLGSISFSAKDNVENSWDIFPGRREIRSSVRICKDTETYF